MRQSTRALLKILLSAFLSLFSLPMLFFGGYFVVCLFRIHFLSVYYTEYSYGTAAIVWLGLCLLSLRAVLHGVWRRSYYGTLFIVPVLVGLAAMVLIPDLQPRYPSVSADDSFLRHVKESVQVWYESHQRFPIDAAEFREAVGTISLQQSTYLQRGARLPYEIVSMAGASGPKVDDVSPRPGEVYYCVSGDSQEFWVTMTSMRNAVASRAVLARFLGLANQKVLVVHATGHDYSDEKPL